MARMKLTSADPPDALKAGYDCPCGCHPQVEYVRGATPATEGCCCGNQFVVGPRASARLDLPAGFRAEVEQFQAPWGERLEAAWAIGPSKH